MGVKVQGSKKVIGGISCGQRSLDNRSRDSLCGKNRVRGQSSVVGFKAKGSAVGRTLGGRILYCGKRKCGIVAEDGTVTAVQVEDSGVAFLCGQCHSADRAVIGCFLPQPGSHCLQRKLSGQVDIDAGGAKSFLQSFVSGGAYLAGGAQGLLKQGAHLLEQGAVHGGIELAVPAIFAVAGNDNVNGGQSGGQIGILLFLDGGRGCEKGVDLVGPFSSEKGDTGKQEQGAERKRYQNQILQAVDGAFTHGDPPRSPPGGWGGRSVR